MVARGAGAAGPVLLACRQWDPFGLVRALPSLGVGAWHCAPLLPWRVQCPVCLCAALAAGSGGSGRYLVLCLSRFTFPPRVFRAACGGLSRPGVPYPRSLVRQSTRSVRSARPVRLPFWWSPRALSVCVRSRSRGVRSPPSWVVWGAHFARSRLWALVGPFHVVLAPPRVLPRSLAPSGVLGGGAVRSRFPPTWLGVVGVAVGRPRGGGAAYCCEGHLVSGAPPPLTARPLGGLLGSAIHVLWARACGRGGPFCPLSLHAPWELRAAGRVRGVRVPGGGLGGGGGVHRTPRLCGQGGPVGRGVALRRSVPLPPLSRQQSGCPWCRAVDGGRGPPYHSGSCSPAFSGRDLCGVLARWRGLACSPRPLWELAAGGGGRVALQLLSLAGWGTILLPQGVGAGAPAACGPAGGGGGGGVSPQSPCSPSGWRPAVLSPGPPCVVGALHSGVCVRSGLRIAAPGWGGVRGGPCTAPLGAPADLNPPSALPEWAAVTGGSCRARPPYCSGAPPRAAPKLGARVAPARWCGLALWPRPPREQAAGGAGARGVQVQPHPPPPASRSLPGGGGVSSAPGGRRAAPVAPKLGGGSGGEGGGGFPPAPPPRRASACHQLSPACPL